MGLVFRLSLANQSGSFLVSHTEPRQIPDRRILGDWQDMWTGVSSLLLTFLQFFQLVVACQFQIPYQDLLFKITHASGYYGAWPGLAVSVSGSPNKTSIQRETTQKGPGTIRERSARPAPKCSSRQRVPFCHHLTANCGKEPVL